MPVPECRFQNAGSRMVVLQRDAPSPKLKRLVLFITFCTPLHARLNTSGSMLDVMGSVQRRCVLDAWQHSQTQSSHGKNRNIK